jgi:hypothetical protein
VPPRRQGKMGLGAPDPIGQEVVWVPRSHPHSHYRMTERITASRPSPGSARLGLRAWNPRPDSGTGVALRPRDLAGRARRMLHAR